MSKAELRNHALAKRVYKLRLEGVSVKQTAEAVGIHKGKVRSMQLLGERLMQLES
ncbi:MULTISPECIES: hypothetical protein [Pseudomonas]|uniref:hypothetical protein n=1 Tax=Pseudomonas TaxID=286 RepID=UPI001F4410F6|nr:MULTISPECIES: hypothetical protein [Pseudomonas]UJW20809.1 hypothetical protein L2Y89_17775 [Pseudomonas juntendi]